MFKRQVVAAFSVPVGADANGLVHQAHCLIPPLACVMSQCRGRYESAASGLNQPLVETRPSLLADGTFWKVITR